jgi:hypothetical protein
MTGVHCMPQIFQSKKFFNGLINQAAERWFSSQEMLEIMLLNDLM